MKKNVLNPTFAANMSSAGRSRRRLPYALSAITNFGDTNRNDSREYGYPDHIDFHMYYNAYRRGGFFNALVDIVPERCFADDPIIIDGDNDTPQDTDFERAVKKLAKKFDLWRLFKEAQKYSDVAAYSAITPIFAESEKVDLMQPLTNVREVVAINAWYQIECEASTEEDSEYGANYKKPKYYTIRPNAITDRSTTTAGDIELHPSRVFVVTNAVGTNIYGEPVLEPAFNALFDANKIRGAAAEGYRKNAKQRTVMSANNEKAAKVMAQQAVAEKINQDVEDWESGFNNILKQYGTDVNVLQSDLTDPTGAHTIALQEACASRRVPVTEVIGFMTGERSSGENSKSFNKRLKTEQKKYGNDIESFLMWLVEYGALPQPSNGEINVCWPDLSEPTESEKLDAAGKMIEQNERRFKSGQDPIWSDEQIAMAAGKELDELDDFDPKEDLELSDDEENTPA